MDLPIRSVMASRTRGASLSLAAGIHAAFAAAFLAVAPKPAEGPPEPVIHMELVAWAPPEPAPLEQAKPVQPSPPTPPPPAPVKTATPKPAPVAVRPAPTVPSTAPAEAAASNTSTAPTASSAPAQTSAAAGHGDPAAEDSYVPPNGKADYLSNPKPAYPSLAQKRGWEGVVTLSVAVDENGLPQEVRVKESSGHSILDRCAIEAVQRWRFVPARRGGRTVTANVEVPVRFGLDDQATG